MTDATPSSKLESGAVMNLMRQLAEGAISVSGNSPLLLCDPSMAWFVVEGHVEVFATELDGAEPVGVRTHYVTASVGSLLFGMTSEGLGHGFLTVGSPGTTLLALPVHKLQSAIGTLEHR